ncbi:hypothetical protein NIES2135_05000 [Leptolyngbya boryana NIES-2135]|jgi:hypothetical protein|uniref:Uncharacterized protein n=1 Tax=Leptolyngbya boryana NIES-2135 TaxID=1973484 RepID=A0A1Z4JAE2_LEPBY|nr:MULTISPECIES: hypothetical protein [Leptolyngbya]BAY53690.1 hypothetical protein NIES2135_05000 [Leptolyngbya boryana NIES-2135]MBD2367871.1 hypothetical protein [Leptolyngbya sp. FACHB-161]MBD2374281.1 hypothetical protein [Leptolyngbya sp. FACHB-238]MBD2398503.1 hypothetical protein [Leptolyngbya sp. FACHB-239]MBD2408317.1 hypothetical protein [Leptolyngbya sp. FACHB-402]
MLTLLMASMFGAYISRRITFHVDDFDQATATLDYKTIWENIVAFFTAISFVCNWAISTGRKTRNYFNNVLSPWLEGFGISIKSPTLQLPALPATVQLD